VSWVEAIWQRFSRAPRGARLLWVAAAACAAHASVLRGGLVWLDHAHLLDGLAIARPGRWLELFRQPFAGTGFYRPLTALSLSVDSLAQSTTFFHVTNLVWHAAASVMVVLAGEALGFSRRAATLGGLLFAVHPLGSLVAGAIAFRSEAMITVALLALVVAHVRHRPILAALALLLGALCKETALVLGPIFVLALELNRRVRAEPPEPTRRRLLAAEASAFAIALGLRWAYAPEWLAKHPELSLSAAIGTRLATLAKSAASFALPIDRTVCDAFPITSASAPLALLGVSIALGVVALALTRSLPAWLLTLSLLPSLQLVPTLRFWSPHYLYVPLAFAALLAAQSLERRGRHAFALTLGVCAALGVVTWTDGRRYANDETLFGPEVAHDPACREGQFYLGEGHRRRQQWAQAEARYEIALASPPNVLAFLDLDAALQNLGVVRLELGKLDAARAAFTAALDETRSESARRKIRHNLAVVELKSGQPAKAVALLGAEAERPDAMPESLRVYAGALQALGREDEARRALERARSRAGRSGVDDAKPGTMLSP